MNSDQPIIIIKKKAAKHAHHGGSWKVAYADFVTAMMAFFLVMWILGLNQDTRQSIAAYFSDPAGMMKTKAGGASVISISNEGQRKKRAITNGKEALLKHKKDQEGLSKAMQEIQQKIAKSPELKAIQKNIEITLSREGLRIELLEDKEPLFFESGRSKLRPHTIRLLREIGPALEKLPNKVLVEGHTDANRYTGGRGSYDNWDLSHDRASAARKALEPGLAQSQFNGTRPYADTRLRNANDPYHYSNRRISVLVTAMDYMEGVPTQSADERGLIGLNPAKPNLQAEFMEQARGSAGGAGKSGH